MPHFSRTSSRRLETCCEPLIELAYRAVEVIDITILYGWRNETDQNMLFDRGLSMLRWPKGKHNTIVEGKPCSDAFDAAPWPIDWDDWDRFYRMAGVMDAIAFDIGIDITWGGDWQSFKDGCHFQIEGR
jgi:peptidoglycan LD-endopeptidase CwlK